jgi:hypothetical protein
VEPGRTTFDPDLDLQPRPLVPDSMEPVDRYQRLVANPFLAALAWLVAFRLINESLNRQNLALFMTSIVLLLVAFFFLQFHCLDCGATGWLLRSWVHACPAVIARRRSRAVRRIHGPGIKLQLVAWFIIGMAAYVLGMVALESRR